jgi:hypothetical protein
MAGKFARQQELSAYGKTSIAALSLKQFLTNTMER